MSRNRRQQFQLSSSPSLTNAGRGNCPQCGFKTKFSNRLGPFFCACCGAELWQENLLASEKSPEKFTAQVAAKKVTLPQITLPKSAPRRFFSQLRNSFLPLRAQFFLRAQICCLILGVVATGWTCLRHISTVSHFPTTENLSVKPQINESQNTLCDFVLSQENYSAWVTLPPPAQIAPQLSTTHVADQIVAENELVYSEAAQKTAAQISAQIASQFQETSAPRDTIFSETLFEERLPPRSPIAPVTSHSSSRAEELLRESYRCAVVDPRAALTLCLQAVNTLDASDARLRGEAFQWLQSMLVRLRATETIDAAIPDIVTLSASHSGRFIAAACRDGSIRLWDTELRQTVTLDQLSVPVVSLIFTADDRFAIVGSADGAITWWRTRRPLGQDAHESFTIPYTLPQLRQVKLSPNGRWLVAFSGNDQNVATAAANPPLERASLLVWDLATLPTNPLTDCAAWHRPMPLRGHAKPIRTVAFSNDSRWIALGSEDCSTRIYDLHSSVVGIGQCVLKGHERDITAIAISPDHSWLATGSCDNTIRIWEWNSGTPLVTLRGHQGWISALAILPDARTLISGSYDQQLLAWDLHALKVSRDVTPNVIAANCGMVRRIEISPDQQTLVVLSGTSSLQFWRLEQGTLSASLDSPIISAVPISDIAFDETNRLIHATLATRHAPSTLQRLPLRGHEMLQAAHNFITR